jgi:hypothetical protein
MIHEALTVLNSAMLMIIFIFMISNVICGRG